MFRPYDYARDRKRYTIIASAFAHADLWHLLFNMITFYYFGARLLEWRIGTPMFITLYTLGLVLSQLGSYRKHRNNPAYATLGRIRGHLRRAVRGGGLLPDGKPVHVLHPHAHSGAAVRGGLPRLHAGGRPGRTGDRSTTMPTSAVR